MPVPVPAPAPAEAGNETPMGSEARAHYERGLSLFQTKDYAGATAELERGYAIEPRREFLFAEAQAKRLAGDCRGAVPLYQRFLATDPPAVQVNATHIALGRCAQQLAAAPGEPPAAPAPAAASKPPPAAPPARPTAPLAPALWTHDRLGAALLGAGVIGLGIGAGFLAAAHAAPTDATLLPEYQRQRSVAESRLTAAVVGLAAGGALATAGIIRYALVRRRAQERLTLIVLPAGGLVIGGRF